MAILRYILRGLLLLLLISCDKSSNNPLLSDLERQQVSIAYLRSIYSSSTIAIKDDIYIEGYLVSSDEQGNNYHSLTLQDDTAGIEIAIDLDDSYKYYFLFSPYRVNCQGLYLGGSNDNVKMGAYSSYYYVTDITEENLSSHISLNDDLQAWSDFPDVLSIGDLNDRYLSTYVYLQGMSLADNILTDKTTGYSIELNISEYCEFYGFELKSDNCGVLGVIDKKDGVYRITPSLSSDIILF